jgi:hypothetical protein
MSNISQVTLETVLQVVNRLEDKIDHRLNEQEKKLDSLEQQVNMIAGKIGMAVIIGTTILGAAMALLIDVIKNLLNTR